MKTVSCTRNQLSSKQSVFRGAVLAAMMVALAGLVAVLVPSVAVAQAGANLDWAQLGATINGESSQDNFGRSVAMSSDGNRVAIGADRNDDQGVISGQVRVHEFDGANWNQIGSDIDGRAGDLFGFSVAISSDGNRVVIGGISNDDNGTSAGVVRVYDFDGSDWNQTGTDINGEAFSAAGWSVAMSSDGNRIAIGEPQNNSSKGQVRVFDFDGADWNQTGSDLNGIGSFDRFGDVIAMSSDGDRIAVGAPEHDFSKGHVRVFDFDGADWNQTGADIDGEDQGEESGRSIAMSSDGDRIVIGAPGNDDGPGRDAGQVRVYDFNGAGWNQTGSDIEGDTWRIYSGQAVVMSSDGNRIGIGQSVFREFSGLVKVYDFNGGDWSQTGSDIDGVVQKDAFGSAAAMSSDGNRLAVGAPAFSILQGSGDVLAFELTTTGAGALCKGLAATIIGSGAINGTAGDDVIVGSDGDDTIQSFGGNDTICAGDGDDVIRAALGDDVISGGKGDDTIFAGAGNDRVFADADADTVWGGNGNDEIFGGKGNDVITAGAGDDVVYAGDGNDTVAAGAGNDELFGQDGDDNLDGGNNDDLLVGGAGADDMVGGWGKDTVTYTDSTGPVTVTINGTANDGESGEGDNVSLSVETIIGSAFDDILIGSNAANTLRGLTGNDVLRGVGGADLVFGGGGNDTMFGGNGTDTLNGGNGTDSCRGGNGTDQFTACETQIQ